MGARSVKPDAAVKGFARRVRRLLPDARIIWFGSRARGEHLQHSDYDFVVISDKFQGIPFTKRPEPLYELWQAQADLEPLCYTPAEFARKAAQITIVAQAAREGVEL